LCSFLYLFGVLPYLHDLALDAEDAIAVKNIINDEAENLCKICVLLVPHISNHTDFDSLRLNPQVDVTYVRVGENIPSCDLIVLPGSKNVISDLLFLKSQGWQEQIQQHCRYGGKVLGICGGYQMLGEKVFDPLAIESSLECIDGLGLLPITTELTANKTLNKVTGTMSLEQQQSDVEGYEIHCGITTRVNSDNLASLVQLNDMKKNTSDGIVSTDNQIIGTYLHGLFDSVQATELVLHWVKPAQHFDQLIDLNKHREQQLNQLATMCKEYINIEQLVAIIKQH